MKKIPLLLSALALIILGGLFLYFYLSGRVEPLLDKSFRIYVLISGIGMLLIGAFNLLNINHQSSDCHHDHDDHDCGHDEHHHHCEHEAEHAKPCEHQHEAHEHHESCCGHDHHHHEAEKHEHHHHHDETPSGVLFSLLIILLPFAFTTVYSKDRYSAGYIEKWGKIERQMQQMRLSKQRAKERSGFQSVGSAPNPYVSAAVNGESDADTPPSGEPGNGAPSWPTFTRKDLEELIPQSKAGDFLIDIPEIFYSAGDRELMGVMEGIPLETTAQLMEETLSNPEGNRLKAFRLFINCCAADARPLSVPIEFEEALPDYDELGWYRIYGNLHYIDEDGLKLPIIRVTRLEETIEPTGGLVF